jgi:PIN domain nuclease of toxin-antitoxin system
MRVLLDTHVFYWWITNQGRLSPQQWKILADDDQPVFVSAVTAWEIAIKVKLGKWNDAAPLLADLEETIRAEGFDVLDLTIAQARSQAGSIWSIAIRSTACSQPRRLTLVSC